MKGRKRLCSRKFSIFVKGNAHPFAARDPGRSFYQTVVGRGIYEPLGLICQLGLSGTGNRSVTIW